MRKTLGLLLIGLAICVTLGACSTPDRSMITQAPAAYSLAEPDALPGALRVPLRFEKGYLFVDSAVDGRRVGTMLLDTGSTLNIIDKGVVNRLGLEELGQGRTVGIAGTEPFSVHAVDELAIAGLDLGVSNAASLSMFKLTRGIGVNPAGLIGSVSLMPHPFAIDYTKQELVIYRRETFRVPKDSERVQLEFYGRLPAVRATLANGVEVLLIIDTGMDSAVSLPMELADSPGILATGASGASAATGVGGRIETRSGWLKDLDVFGFNLGGVPVTFEPKTREPRRDDLPVGRVGGQLLQGFRLTFDAPYRSLWVTFSAPVQE